MNRDLQKTYQKFQEQANNLAMATGPTFDTALNSFLDFCESDSLMFEISKPIRSSPNIDVQSWYRAATTTRRYPPMPSGPDSTLSASYQILSAIRDKKISLEGLAAYLFDATYREAAVVSTYNFIVRPLLQGLLKKMIPSSQSPTIFLAKPEPSHIWEPMIRPMPVETADTIIDRLATTYQDLQRKQERSSQWSGLAVLALVIMLGGTLYTLSGLQGTVVRGPPLVIIPAILIPALLALTLVRLADRNRPDSEERFFLEAYGIATSLRDYRKNPTLTIQVQVERLTKLSDDLQNSWFGDFKLARETLSPIREFIESLKDRLIPVITKGDVRHVDIGVETLAKFSRLLLEEHPQIIELQKINDLMVPLDPVTVESPKWRSRAIAVLRNNPKARWVEVVAISIMVGAFVDAGATYLGAPSWQSFITGATISTLLFVGYLTSPVWRRAIRKQ